MQDPDNDVVTQAHLGKFNGKEPTMLKRLGIFAVALTAGLILSTGSVRAERSEPMYAPAHSQLENTGRNVRDRGDATFTPMDQRNNRRDREITAAIRRSVVNNPSLSFNAHNIKIITRKGMVTLRGPVESVAEKIKLQTIAQRKRGVRHVYNQLEAKRLHWRRR